MVEIKTAWIKEAFNPETGFPGDAPVPVIPSRGDSQSFKECKQIVYTHIRKGMSGPALIESKTGISRHKVARIQQLLRDAGLIKAEKIGGFWQFIVTDKRRFKVERVKGK